MVTTETLEGIMDGALWYHYDAANDVLYLRVESERATPSLGEETDDGFILLRSEATDQVVGLTIVSWWKRFGEGELPDSISEIQRQLQPWAKRLAA